MAFFSPKCPSSRFSLPPSPGPRSRRVAAAAASPSPSRTPLPRRFFSRRISSQSPRNRHWNVVSMHEAATVHVSPKKEIDLKKVENGVSSTISAEEHQDLARLNTSKEDSTVSITVVGASGDLAKKKIFPALFALYYEDCLPEHFTIFGYARSKMTDAELRNMVSQTLTCRIDKRENCSEKMEQFLRRCFYHSGQYDSEENFAELDKKLKEHEYLCRLGGFQTASSIYQYLQIYL